MSLSHRTLALLSGPFAGGSGPSHAQIEQSFAMGDAPEYLELEGNKQSRVLHGLQRLRDGWLAQGLDPDPEKLRSVVENLAVRLLAAGSIDGEELDEALARDGLLLDGSHLQSARPNDLSADAIAAQVGSIFASDPQFNVAETHFDHANANFDQRRWEAANAQFRATFDAAYDKLAYGKGCPSTKKGGAARKWLVENGFLDDDESDLLQSFSAYAGSDGSHAGLSDAANCALRRHMASALIVFGVSKLSAPIDVA